QTEKSPQRHSDGRTYCTEERCMMRIPGINVKRRAKPEPADNAQAYHRNNDPPHSNATDLPGNARTTKVSHGTNPQHSDGRKTNLHWRQTRAEQFGAVTNRRNSNRDVSNQQRDTVGVVRHKIAGLTESILGITAHTT